EVVLVPLAGGVDVLVLAAAEDAAAQGAGVEGRQYDDRPVDRLVIAAQAADHLRPEEADQHADAIAVAHHRAVVVQVGLPVPGAVAADGERAAVGDVAYFLLIAPGELLRVDVPGQIEAQPVRAAVHQQAGELVPPHGGAVAGVELERDVDV